MAQATWLKSRIHIIITNNVCRNVKVKEYYPRRIPLHNANAYTGRSNGHRWCRHQTRFFSTEMRERLRVPADNSERPVDRRFVWKRVSEVIRRTRRVRTHGMYLVSVFWPMQHATCPINPYSFIKCRTIFSTIAELLTHFSHFSDLDPWRPHPTSSQDQRCERCWCACHATRFTRGAKNYFPNRHGREDMRTTAVGNAGKRQTREGIRPKGQASGDDLGGSHGCTDWLRVGHKKTCLFCRGSYWVEETPLTSSKIAKWHHRNQQSCVPKFPKIHKGCFWRMQRWAAWIKNRVRYFKSKYSLRLWIEK